MPSTSVAVSAAACSDETTTDGTVAARHFDPIAIAYASRRVTLKGGASGP